MTLRKLPNIKAFERPDSLKFEPDESALAKWRPEITAAHAEDNDISILDVIGEDMFGDGVSAKRIAAALRRIGDQDVVVNINSPGGDFFEGVAIYNMLLQHPHKVTVRVVGLAASAASIVAMAGDQIEISEIGFLMVHNAWALAIGNRHDMREAADMLEPFDDAMASVYAKRAGVEKPAAAEWMDKETWFNGEQAVEAGLADGLLPDAEIGEMAQASMKSLAAHRRVETALAKQGLSRNERRSLIGELTARPAVADEERSAVASDDVAALSAMRDALPG